MNHFCGGDYNPAAAGMPIHNNLRLNIFMPCLMENLGFMGNRSSWQTLGIDHSSAFHFG